MNMTIAQQLLCEAGRLLSLVAVFQARYGKNYNLIATSPEAAWRLHRQIFDAQRSVARLLVDSARENPRPRYGQWWDRQDVLDTSLAHEIVSQASHLVTACAYEEASYQINDRQESHSVLSIQRAIAGTLHPNSLHIVNDTEIVRNAS